VTDDSKRVSRRKFVAGAVATGAAATLPDDVQAATGRRRHRRPNRTRTVDVAVVGAGFAGMTAARNIVRAGRSVAVLEARGRVGGRAWNHHLGGGLVSERGATFVGPTQTHVLALGRDLGIGTFPTYDSGKNLYVSGKTRITYSDTAITGTAPPDPLVLPDLAVFVGQLDQMSTEVPVNAPWDAPKAAEWEAQTLESWFGTFSIAVTPQFRALVPVATRPIFGAEPRELSLLFVLFYIAASGDESHRGTFERNFDTRGGAQQSRFIGGTQAIPLKIAAQLGERVVLDSPVRRISQGRSRATIVSDRLTVHAKRVIVAIPPALAARIDYEPILPFERDQLTQRYAQGTLTKVAAVYDTPFWRDAGLNGQAFTTGGPVSATFDDSPPGGKPGVVFGFVGGDNARAYARMSPSSRRAAVLDQYANFFGPRALKPKGFFETQWSAEQWSRGCPVGIPSPGTLVAYGARLREPVGRIHWAGTETSGYWNGYMDGAVRSGERAAAEVLAGL
jgi:monoamine oxidase